MKLKSAFLPILFVITLLISGQSLFSQNKKQVDDPDSFTNLFQSDSENVTSEIKKRAATSVLLSGTKFGTKVGFNFNVQDNPNLANTFFIDIPFTKKLSALLEVGPQTITIEEHEFNNTNSARTDKIISNAQGEKNYISVSGQVRYYLNALYFGAGINFYYYLTGHIDKSTVNSGINENHVIVDDNNLFLGSATFGYLAEIRPNVFLTPEFNFFISMPPTGDDRRIIINGAIGLAFKL